MDQTSENVDTGEALVPFVPWEGLPEPRRNTVKKRPLSRKGKRSTVAERSYLLSSRETIPGQIEYRTLRNQQTGEFAKGRPGRRAGLPDGYTRATIGPARAEAKEKVDKYFAILMTAFPTDDELVIAARKTLLEAMNNPGDPKTKLSAARTVLDMFHVKPAAKQELTIKTAEEWVMSLAEPPPLVAIEAPTILVEPPKKDE